MIELPQWLRPEINTIYPYENFVIFERWLLEQTIPTTKRQLLPIQWTAFQVNNKYGKDKEALCRLQNFINELPTDIAYWTCVQYDDGILVDVSKLDLLQFSMSKNIGVPIPLICQPHSYKHDGTKNIFASFIGTHTHAIREKILDIKNDNCYISDKQHGVNEFCKIIASSVFGLCPRGYGANSFRTTECMQYGTIPVYISDEFIIPFNIHFNEFGILVKESDIFRLDYILFSIDPLEILRKQDKIKKIYKEYYTYEGLFKNIIKHLEGEA